MFVLGIFIQPTFVNANDNSSKNVISVAMATDDNYIYPTIVSMTSLARNSNRNTIYHIYIMHPDNLSHESKSKLLSVEEKYKNCIVKFVDMKNIFKEGYTDHRIPTSAYYRLAMPDVIHGVDKIIWLDGDTLVLGDLSEMINIDMEGYYFKGFLDFPNLKETENFGIYNDHYICSGVMLVNLRELRRDNMNVNAVSRFITQNYNKLWQHDQTVVNTLFMHKNGVLPPKFGVWNFDIKDHIYGYQGCVVYPYKYSVQEIIDAWQNPVILHCTNKPWKNLTKALYVERWWKYAEVSGFLKEIQEKYLIPDGIYEISPVSNRDKLFTIHNLRHGIPWLYVSDKDNSESQKFKIRYKSAGTFAIETFPDKTLYVSKFIKHSSKTGLSHKWYFIPCGDGSYRIASKLNKHFMTINGSFIKGQDENNSDSQKFILKKLA